MLETKENESTFDCDVEISDISQQIQHLQQNLPEDPLQYQIQQLQQQQQQQQDLEKELGRDDFIHQFYESDSTESDISYNEVTVMHSNGLPSTPETKQQINDYDNRY